jgi:hypothetical protein
VTNGGRITGLDVVKRLTATQVLTERGQRFNRTTGRQTGAGPWHVSYIEEPTPEQIHDLKMQTIRVRLARVDWTKISDDILKAVFTLVKG